MFSPRRTPFLSSLHALKLFFSERAAVYCYLSLLAQFYVMWFRSMSFKVDLTARSSDLLCVFIFFMNWSAVIQRTFQVGNMSVFEKGDFNFQYWSFYGRSFFFFFFFTFSSFLGLKKNFPVVLEQLFLNGVLAVTNACIDASYQVRLGLVILIIATLTLTSDFFLEVACTTTYSWVKLTVSFGESDELSELWFAVEPEYPRRYQTSKFGHKSGHHVSDLIL